MSLPTLRLRHGHARDRDARELAGVTGATPLFRCLAWHREGWDVHFHPTSLGGRSETSNPVREGVSNRGPRSLPMSR